MGHSLQEISPEGTTQSPLHILEKLPNLSASMLVTLGRLDIRGRLSYTRWEALRRQPPQNFFPQLLRLPEELLIFDKHPVQFNRLVGRQLMPQQHVADVHRIR